MEVQEVVADILNVLEQKAPVHKHGRGRCCSCGVESMPGRTARFDPSGCSVEVDQGVGVKPHILKDMVQEDLCIQGAIQPRSDGPQGGQGTFHGRVI